MLHGTIQQYLNYSKYEMTKQIDQKKKPEYDQEWKNNITL